MQTNVKKLRDHLVNFRSQSQKVEAQRYFSITILQKTPIFLSDDFFLTEPRHLTQKRKDHTVIFWTINTHFIFIEPHNMTQIDFESFYFAFFSTYLVIVVLYHYISVTFILFFFFSEDLIWLMIHYRLRNVFRGIHTIALHVSCLILA